MLEKIDTLNQLVQSTPGCNVGERDLLDGEKIAADLIHISTRNNLEVAVQDLMNQDDKLISTPKFSEQQKDYQFNSTYSAGMPLPNKFINATIDPNVKIHKLKIRVQPMLAKDGEDNSF